VTGDTGSQRTLEIQRASFLPESVRPENVLADLLLIYWPEAAVRRGLAKSGGTVTDQGSTRSIGRDGDDLIVIRYDGAPWTGAVHLTNRAWHYDIDVRSAAVGS
jgi:hypothetical protein